MSNSIISEFHILAKSILSRDRSLLDIMTKLQESNAKAARSISRAITKCGCLSLEAKKQHFPKTGDLSSLPLYADDHISGYLCSNCKESIEQAIADNLFYLTSICNALDMNLEDIMNKELTRCNLLGKYSLK